MLRFAPLPTGDMHLDDLRVAILNYLVAQQKNDQFLIRIEDGDTKRNIEGKDTEIMMILEKFALKHDSVFHQSEHLNLHQTLALRLLKDEKAFVCKCTDEEIEADRKKAKANNVVYHYSGHCENLTSKEYTTLQASGEPFVIRLKKPTQNITNHDILQGDISTSPKEVDSLVILNANSTPTYNFACACDDMMSNIDFIIRTEEHLTNTPKQMHIKNVLGYEHPTVYAHLPTILNAPSLQWLFEQGFVPDAILNYLILLGNAKVPQEIFTLPEAIEWFELSTLSKSSTQFDLEKLRFINREHLRRMEDKQLSTLFDFADADIGKLAKLYLEECSTIHELEAKIRPIFKPKNFKGEGGEEMKIISDIIFQAPAFETFEAFKTHISIQSGITSLNKPLRYLLTGNNTGPELSEIYPFIKSYILEVAS